MGRPKGTKDSKPRKKRNQYGFSSIDIQQIIELKNQQKTNKDISNITGLSEAQIKKICRENNIKQIDTKILINKPLLSLDDSSQIICGIYIITIYRKDGYQGHYIGSSVNIRKRCLNHRSELVRGEHYNRNLQKDFNNSILHEYRIWSVEEETNLLKRENEIIKTYAGLYNSNSSVIIDSDALPYLKKATNLIKDEKYTINNTMCWEWKSVNKKSGYGRTMHVSIGGNTKYFIPHRVSYYKYYGEYPELIRHKCNNRSCVNPNHLEAGSYRDNAIDTHVDKWNEFRNKWKEFNGDYVKLTEYFGYKKNCKSKNGDMYSLQISKIVKKLELM